MICRNLFTTIGVCLYLVVSICCLKQTDMDPSTQLVILRNILCEVCPASLRLLQRFAQRCPLLYIFNGRNILKMNSNINILAQSSHKNICTYLCYMAHP